MKYVDTQKRESEILAMVVESYIKESRPISSGYLREKFRLPYSTATLRNVLGSLEKRGLLFHVHISSGRVPTQEGFRQYVESLRLKETAIETDEIDQELEFAFELEGEISLAEDMDRVLYKILDRLAMFSGYTSMVAIYGEEYQRFIFRGTRFMFEQPEFGDISQLKSIFYALEMKINTLQRMLLNYFDERVKVLVGDDIACEGISGCAMVLTGARCDNLSAALAFLGPMRMDYARAISVLSGVRDKFSRLVRMLGVEE